MLSINKAWQRLTELDNTMRISINIEIKGGEKDDRWICYLIETNIWKVGKRSKVVNSVYFLFFLIVFALG